MHNEAVKAYTKLLEARLLLIECKYALIKLGARNDLVEQVDKINHGFTYLRWEDTRSASGRLLETLEVAK